MIESTTALAALTRDLVAIDSRSFVSNFPLAARLEAELSGFDLERLDYADAAGTPKRVLVAHRGGPGGIAFSGHMDTVPDTGWQEDPWSGRIDPSDGTLHGLGATDMKGPVAAAVLAMQGLPGRVPVTLLMTTDEETTKEGARQIIARSDLARAARPVLIVVAEPTGLKPVRGHRAHVAFTCVAAGVQAHSSTGRGRNANWDLIPFLAEMIRRTTRHSATSTW
jgi:acetylornithine deacetylase